MLLQIAHKLLLYVMKTLLLHEYIPTFPKLDKTFSGSFVKHNLCKKTRQNIIIIVITPDDF